MTNIDPAALRSRVEQAQLFSRRFGSFAKSDYEVLMFTVYLDSLTVPARDYDISIELGITESKVRSLREKSQLLYPRELNWQEELAAALEKGHYDEDEKTVTVTLEDPSVRNKIRSDIEREFGVVNLSLNSRQLVIPLESLLYLAIIADGGDSDALIDKLNETWSTAKELSERITMDKNWKKKRFLKDCSNIQTVIGTASAVLTGGQTILRALTPLLGG